MNNHITIELFSEDSAECGNSPGVEVCPVLSLLIKKSFRFISQSIKIQRIKFVKVHGKGVTGAMIWQKKDLPLKIKERLFSSLSSLPSLHVPLTGIEGVKEYTLGKKIRNLLRR